MIKLECHVSNRPNVFLSLYNKVKISHNLIDFSNSHSEQSSERTSNGGIARSENVKKSATGKIGIKRKLDYKTLDIKYNAIIEVEKGVKSRSCLMYC